MLDNRQIPGSEKLDHFLSCSRVGDAVSTPPWFSDLKGSAAEGIRVQGFPHVKLESWEFSQVRKVLADTYEGPVAGLSEEALRRRLRSAAIGADLPSLVFANGRMVPSLSAIGKLPEGVEVVSMSGLEAYPEVREWLISRAASFKGAEASFRGLNLIMGNEPMVLLVQSGVALKEEIRLVFLSSGKPEHRAMVNPGVFVYAGEGASIALVELHIGVEEGRYLSNSCTMLAAEKGSVVRHIKIIEETSDGYHLSSILAEQAEASELKTHTLIRSGGLVRNEVEVDLNGEGCRAELYGLYLAAGEQQIENSTCIRHNQPGCKSREHYKGILNQRARAVFRGRIVVAENAQQTDSKQTNNNLLLSEDARINSKPQLEIYADDVSCTHGATVGQLEEEKLFYLQSRGISRTEANALLIRAFGNEVVSRIDSERLRLDLEEHFVAEISA